MRTHFLSAVFVLISLALSVPAARAASDYLGAVPPKVKSPPKVAKTTCSACHGARGKSIAPTYPDLAGQNYGYLLKQLEDFQSGKRSDSVIMTQMAKLIPAAPHHANLKAVAAWYAQQPPVPAAPSSAIPLNKARAKLGYQIYAFGRAKQAVPACSACHMENGRGNGPMAIPALAGQHATYILAQLQKFASGKRSNSPHHVMKLIAGRLSMKDLKALAAYVHAMQTTLLPGAGPKSYQAYEKALKTQAVPGVPASALASSKPSSGG